MSSPSSSRTALYYRNQVEENCAFICSRDDIISVITTKEASGQWKAIALRSNEDLREEVLSSKPSGSLQKALESLHLKSAEAVSVYIKSNGFCHLPDIKTESDSEDDDNCSVVSGHSTVSGYDSAVDTSDEDEPRTPASSSAPGIIHIKPKGSRETRKRGKARKSRASKETYETDDECINAPPPPARVPQPQLGPPMAWAAAGPPPPSRGGIPPPPPSIPLSHRSSAPILPMQPPPPPAYNHQPPTVGLGAPGGSAPPVNHLRPPPPPGLRPGARPIPPRQYNVRIAIRWLQHSEVRILECCPASIMALQDTSVSYVRRNMNAFQNVTPLDYSNTRMLVAQVKQAFFGSEAYDMAGYRGDDLTKLLSVLSQDDVPLFEVTVESVRPIPPPPPPPMNLAPPVLVD